MLAIELKRSGFDRGRPLAECPRCVADRLGTSGGEPLSDEDAERVAEVITRRQCH